MLSSHPLLLPGNVARKTLIKKDQVLGIRAQVMKRLAFPIEMLE